MNTQYILTPAQTRLLFALVSEYLLKGGIIVTDYGEHAGCDDSELDSLARAVGEADRLVLTNSVEEFNNLCEGQ